MRRNHTAETEDLIRQLSAIQSEMRDSTQGSGEGKRDLHQSHHKSARNLVHYLTLRRHDIRPLQERLASLGLSSLGRAESNVLVSVERVLSVLHRLAGRVWQPPATPDGEVDFSEGRALLEAHTKALLGPRPVGRDVRIMVTMPTEAATNYPLVRDLLAQGMDCMRINCAYDHKDAWASMIDNLERAKRKLGRECRILMDLAGPKLRTGAIEPAAQVIKWRPRRDRFGSVKAAVRLWLTAMERAESAPIDADATLPVPASFLEALEIGDIIKFFDARGASRFIKVVALAGENRWAESTQTTYVVSGTTLHSCRASPSFAPRVRGVARLGALQPQPRALLLKEGDTLWLTSPLVPGRAAEYDDHGKPLTPATIGVTLPEVLADLRTGESIWLDDGKIGGVVRLVETDRVGVEITHARPSGARLATDKGINLPDSNLGLPSLTAKDIDDLPFIARHADLVGYSFVRSEADVRELQTRLGELGGDHLGIVLKIETRRAFEQLPNLLLAAMRSPCAGVMIARGDLAVECGYERMAEAQEEILWIAEAAHMPVIWATQVLEGLAKDGLPSRAEITDAAMGERAECVMLNKGPYIVEAVRALDDILRRMQAHQSKKRSMLRRLGLAHNFSQTR